MCRNNARRLAGWLAASLLSCAIAAGTASAGTDFQISPGGAEESAVAYNSTAKEYLVTWFGPAPGLASGHNEIFGQRLNAITGDKLGPTFRISTTGSDGDPSRAAASPSVVYNPTANQYLVTWRGDPLATVSEFEIFGQRLSATGAELGPDFRISTVGADGDVNRGPTLSSVAYNTKANEYLVTWDGDYIDNEFRIYGQRLNSSGAELGGDFQISDAAGDRDAHAPSVAYDELENEYLVAWYGDQLATPTEVEIFGERLSAAGVGQGGLRISTTGADGDVTRAAKSPAVGWNQYRDTYLVVWQGEGDADDKVEIFGQTLSGAGGHELGGDFRISTTGSSGEKIRSASAPALAYSPAEHQFLVTWLGNDLANVLDYEIFGQRVAVGGGTDFQISHMGDDGATSHGVKDSAVAWGPSADQYLVTWTGDGQIFGSLYPKPTPKCTLDPKGSKVKAPKPRTLKLTATCDRAATLNLVGTITAKPKRKDGKPKPHPKTFAVSASGKATQAGRAVTLTVKVPKNAIKLLKKKAKESVAFLLTASNNNGSSTATAKIKTLKLKR